MYASGLIESDQSETAMIADCPTKQSYQLSPTRCAQIALFFVTVRWRGRGGGGGHVFLSFSGWISGFMVWESVPLNQRRRPACKASLLALRAGRRASARTDLSPLLSCRPPELVPMPISSVPFLRPRKTPAASRQDIRAERNCRTGRHRSMMDHNSRPFPLGVVALQQPRPYIARFGPTFSVAEKGKYLFVGGS